MIFFTVFLSRLGSIYTGLNIKLDQNIEYGMKEHTKNRGDKL